MVNKTKSRFVITHAEIMISFTAEKKQRQRLHLFFSRLVEQLKLIRKGNTTLLKT